MSLHVPLRVHSRTINLYIFISSPDSEAKASGLQPFLERMPEQHVHSALDRYTIFVIRAKPRGGDSGGTWLPGQVRRAFWGRESVTGVPDADLERLVLNPGKGLIGIPLDRWERPLARLKFTVLHEVGHCVDYRMNLSPPGATAGDFTGVRPVCGAADIVKRHAVEAYARLVLGAGICRNTAPADAGRCNARIISLLRRAPAFSSVSSSWWHSGRTSPPRETEEERIRRQSSFWAERMVERSGMRYRMPGPTGVEIPNPREAALRHVLSEEPPPAWIRPSN